MKKLLFISMLFLSASGMSGQPCFDLGLKGGATLSELYFRHNPEYTSDNLLSYHIGIFSRIGWGRLYLQPEVYYNSRGGALKTAGNIQRDAVANFDFSSVDVPVLAGIKLVKGDFFNVRAMGGPVFGFLTSRNVEPAPSFSTAFSKQYFKDHFYGWQYGLGFDLWFLTFDVRMERSRNSVYQSSDFTTKNNLFLVSAGIKIF
jgi:hypothetical protein